MESVKDEKKRSCLSKKKTLICSELGNDKEHWETLDKAWSHDCPSNNSTDNETATTNMNRCSESADPKSSQDTAVSLSDDTFENQTAGSYSLSMLWDLEGMASVYNTPSHTEQAFNDSGVEGVWDQHGPCSPIWKPAWTPELFLESDTLGPSDRPGGNLTSSEFGPDLQPIRFYLSESQNTGSSDSYRDNTQYSTCNSQEQQSSPALQIPDLSQFDEDTSDHDDFDEKSQLSPATFLHNFLSTSDWAIRNGEEEDLPNESEYTNHGYISPTEFLNSPSTSSQKCSTPASQILNNENIFDFPESANNMDSSLQEVPIGWKQFSVEPSYDCGNQSRNEQADQLFPKYSVSRNFNQVDSIYSNSNHISNVDGDSFFPEGSFHMPDQFHHSASSNGQSTYDTQFTPINDVCEPNQSSSQHKSVISHTKSNIPRSVSTGTGCSVPPPLHPYGLPISKVSRQPFPSFPPTQVSYSQRFPRVSHSFDNPSSVNFRELSHTSPWNSGFNPVRHPTLISRPAPLRPPEKNTVSEQKNISPEVKLPMKLLPISDLLRNNRKPIYSCPMEQYAINSSRFTPIQSTAVCTQRCCDPIRKINSQKEGAISIKTKEGKFLCMAKDFHTKTVRELLDSAENCKERVDAVSQERNKTQKNNPADNNNYNVSMKQNSANENVEHFTVETNNTTEDWASMINDTGNNADASHVFGSDPVRNVEYPSSSTSQEDTELCTNRKQVVSEEERMDYSQFMVKETGKSEKQQTVGNKETEMDVSMCSQTNANRGTYNSGTHNESPWHFNVFEDLTPQENNVTSMTAETYSDMSGFVSNYPNTGYEGFNNKSPGEITFNDCLVPSPVSMSSATQRMDSDDEQINVVDLIEDETVNSMSSIVSTEKEQHAIVDNVRHQGETCSSQDKSEYLIPPPHSSPCTISLNSSDTMSTNQTPIIYANNLLPVNPDKTQPNTPFVQALSGREFIYHGSVQLNPPSFTNQEQTNQNYTNSDNQIMYNSIGGPGYYSAMIPPREVQLRTAQPYPLLPPLYQNHPAQSPNKPVYIGQGQSSNYIPSASTGERIADREYTPDFQDRQTNSLMERSGVSEQPLHHYTFTTPTYALGGLTSSRGYVLSEQLKQKRESMKNTNFKPKHFDFERLEVGNYKYSCEDEDGKTAKVKLLFSKRRLVYEFQLNEMEQVHKHHQRKLALIEISFKTIVQMWGEGNEFKIEVSLPPKVYQGEQLFKKDFKFGVHSNARFQRKKENDMTDGEIHHIPYHYVQLKGNSVEKLTHFLQLFDENFEIMLNTPYVEEHGKLLKSDDEPNMLIPIVLSKLPPPPPDPELPKRPSILQRNRDNSSGCHCYTGCRTSRCSCSRLIRACGSMCHCANCANLFNLLNDSHISTEKAKEDSCLIQNLFKSALMDNFGNKFTHSLWITHRPVRNLRNRFKSKISEVRLTQKCKLFKTKLLDLGLHITYGPTQWAKLFKLVDLERFLKTDITLPCCNLTLSIIECIPGEKGCPNYPRCLARYQFSWCSGTLCDQVNNPRNHCKICQSCAGKQYRHCGSCNRCYFAGVSGFSCPTCSQDVRVRETASNLLTDADLIRNILPT